VFKAFDCKTTVYMCQVLFYTGLFFASQNSGLMR
jgi:hypothetical protein